MQNFIYNQFQENKQLFKPYVSWPEVVHLGLNNVDAISNTFLKNIKFSSGERLLWVCYHKATFSFGSHNPNDGIACGCIITDHRIYYRNITKPKEFEVEWENIVAITHDNHVFKIKTSRDEYILPEEALLGRQIKKNDSVVSFFTQKVIVDNKGVTKEKLAKDIGINSKENLNNQIGHQTESLSHPKEEVGDLGVKADGKDNKVDKPKTRRSFL